MKRFISLLVSILLFAATLLPVLPVQAESVNLIVNPSVETASGSNPADWTANNWGNNTTTLTYENSGHTGDKSLRVDMTAHTDGDAKWMHDPVAVSQETSYTYTGYYKSSGDTEIDLQYTDTSGNVSYAYAQYVPASVDWAPISTTFVTPANVASVVVMHVVAGTAWLQTDDFSLGETVTPPVPTEGNLIANSSMETANGAVPAGWLTNAWGTNSSNFVYETNGHTGSRSVTTAITSHTDGDAKWYAEPVAIEAGATYLYSDYYKSGTSTPVVAAFIDGAGNYSYQELASAPASADWAQYTASFTAPASAVSATVFHVLDSVGSLTIDDVSLAEEEHSHEDGENIIHNASLETANGNAPAEWLTNAWGANTPNFVYETTGHTGSRSVTATLTNHTDGDAKWYFNPVSVTPGKSYLYRDFYKATVDTRVVAAFIDGAGTYSYQELGSAPAASDWTQYEASFIVPATTVQTTVFHLIENVGSLTIDDALLQVSLPPGGVEVPNGSLEEGTSSPNGWQNSSWGTNNPNFEYVTNEGHTGSKSIKVTMSDYASGDAKWYFDPINNLTPGTQYRFTVWYKGTVTPHATTLHLDENGNEQYLSMQGPQTVSSTEWQQYTDTFTVPENAVATSVFLFVTGNGWLQTDDYSIAEYTPNGFNRPLVTLTFDDGHEDNTETALPIMESHGFKSTQCYATNFIEGMSQEVIDGVMQFYNSGHEICSHTVTHPFLTTVSDPDLHFELEHSQDYLEGLIGEPVRNFASPYGDYNAAVNDAIDDYYQSHRTVDEGFNSKDNFDVYRLRVQNVLDTTTATQVEEWVNQAIADNTWLILVYHRVADDPGPYDAYTDAFEDQMQVIADSGVTVKTYQAALEEILPQL